jgi:hypothetical protein
MKYYSVLTFADVVVNGKALEVIWKLNVAMIL